MANYNDIIQALNKQFTDYNNNFIQERFNDYFQVVLYNTRSANETLFNCSERSLNGYVFDFVKRETKDLIIYNDINENPTDINNEQFKKALSDISGKDYRDVLKGTIDYFKNERYFRNQE